MPSSSAANTYQETEIEIYFKRAYLRFFFSGLHKEASAVCEIFSEVLDQTQKYIMGELWKDRDSLMQWEKLVKSKKRSENAWYAANAISDAAAILNQFGRNEECKMMCEWANVAQELSRRLQEFEEN